MNLLNKYDKVNKTEKGELSMFGFGKKSKALLANKIIELSVDASEQFLEYLKADTYLYNKCINQNPIKNTGAIFMINIYRDMLNSKYDSKDVFTVIRTAMLSIAPNKSTDELFMNTLMQYMQMCNQTVEYYKQFPNFNMTEALTKVFFSLVIDDREYLEMEIDDEIVQTVSFRKIYNYINGVMNSKTLLNDEYNLKKR